MTVLPALAVRAVLLAVAALLPALLPAALPARPDLVLLVVVAAALTHGPLTGALLGLTGGWLLDLLPPGGVPLGGAALTYLAAGAFTGWARRYASWSPLLPLLAALGAAGLVQGVRGVSAAAGVGLARPHELLWSVAITTLAAVLVLPVLLAVERAMGERRWV